MEFISYSAGLNMKVGLWFMPRLCRLVIFTLITLERNYLLLYHVLVIDAKELSQRLCMYVAPVKVGVRHTHCHPLPAPNGDAQGIYNKSYYYWYC